MGAPGKKREKNLYLHADGDSFFVSCELTLRPELKGRPVIVGGDRGIAVAMSPEAKRAGVTRGMPVFRIKKLFPQVVILPHTFDLYTEIAEKMKNILLSYASKVEEYSIDECFALVDPAEIKFFGSEKKLLLELKREIESVLGVTYSLGIGRTKSLSKLASKLEKPGGVVALLNKKDEERALKATSIGDVWGIGRQTVPGLVRLGIKTAYDFAKYPAEEIERNFSRPVRELQRELSGTEVLSVNFDADPRDQKSIQSTRTFRPASTDQEIIRRELSINAERACKEARALLLVSNIVSFFVKTSEFVYYESTAKLPSFTSDPGTVLEAIEQKFPELVKRKGRIRATGVILQNLVREEKVPLDLFGRQKEALDRLEVERAADRIRAKYGRGSITRAASLQKRNSKD